MHLPIRDASSNGVRPLLSGVFTDAPQSFMRVVTIGRWPYLHAAVSSVSPLLGKPGWPEMSMYLDFLPLFGDRRRDSVPRRWRTVGR